MEQLSKHSPSGNRPTWVNQTCVWSFVDEISNVVYYVSRGREIYFTTSVLENGPAIESWSAMGSLDDLRQAFAGFHPEVQRLLEACPSVNRWAIEHLAAPRH